MCGNLMVSSGIRAAVIAAFQELCWARREIDPNHIWHQFALDPDLAVRVFLSRRQFVEALSFPTKHRQEMSGLSRFNTHLVQDLC